jgi:hypothetical protein
MVDKPFILAIDPGNKMSAYCLVSPYLRPLAFGKHVNTERPDIELDSFEGQVRWALLKNDCFVDNTIIVIENIESFGMPVSRTVFDTCIYIGELKRQFHLYGYKVDYVYRHEEKLFICHSSKANDATIKQALVDRFAYGEKNYGKGVKADPGFFYGFSKDVWSAFAQAVTYHDKYLAGNDLHLDELPF